MKSVFVIWQDVEKRMWHPVAKLTLVSDGGYKLNYTKGAEHSRFIPFPRMTDMSKTYYSNELFPFFKNRILSERRPEFFSMLDWSDLSLDNYSPLSLLAISGGERKTDSFRIVSVPENNRGYYRIRFFVSAIRYLSEEDKENLFNISRGDVLNFVFEDNNPNDQDAILLTDPSGNYKVGYYPRYLSRDFRKLKSSCQKPSVFEVKVVKVNDSAPEQYRLLCEFTSDWPDGFLPFKSLEYFDYY